jgi:hypothetical protein
MTNRTTSKALKLILCLLLLYPATVSSQTPPQPGKLSVTSTPEGAKVTVNGKPTNRNTPAILVVTPGSYNVSVAGVPGRSTCQESTFTVSAGEALHVDCSGGNWKQ